MSFFPLLLFFHVLNRNRTSLEYRRVFPDSQNVTCININIGCGKYKKYDMKFMCDTHKRSCKFRWHKEENIRIKLVKIKFISFSLLQYNNYIHCIYSFNTQKAFRIPLPILNWCVIKQENIYSNRNKFEMELNVNIQNI